MMGIARDLNEWRQKRDLILLLLRTGRALNVSYTGKATYFISIREFPTTLSSIKPSTLFFNQSARHYVPVHIHNHLLKVHNENARKTYLSKKTVKPGDSMSGSNASGSGGDEDGGGGDESPTEGSG